MKSKACVEQFVIARHTGPKPTFILTLLRLVYFSRRCKSQNGAIQLLFRNKMLGIKKTAILFLFHNVDFNFNFEDASNMIRIEAIERLDTCNSDGLWLDETDALLFGVCWIGKKITGAENKKNLLLGVAFPFWICFVLWFQFMLKWSANDFAYNHFVTDLSECTI